jgi:hypothetical protein
MVSAAYIFLHHSHQRTESLSESVLSAQIATIFITLENKMRIPVLRACSPEILFELSVVAKVGGSFLRD